MTVLIIILVFILGVRLGQKVEKTNKVIDVMLSIPPSARPNPTSGQLEFKQHVNLLCGIKFLYPSDFEVKKVSSISAVFLKKDQEQIEYDCTSKNKLEEVLTDEEIASAEINFKNARLKGKNTNNNTTLLFQIKNPNNRKNIDIAIQKNLYPLFEKSLEFEK